MRSMQLIKIRFAAGGLSLNGFKKELFLLGKIKSFRTLNFNEAH